MRFIWCTLAISVMVALPWGPAAPAEPWGWLGVGIQTVAEELSWQLVARFGPLEGNGVQVVDVLPDGPARAAGFHGADVIVQVAGRRVWDVKGLQRLVRTLPIGMVVEVIVLREQERIVLHPQIAPMPQDVARGLAGERYGLVLRTSPATATEEILLVTAVEAGSSAEAAGIRPGDVVVEVQGRQVRHLRDYAEIVLHLDGSRPLRVVVHRGEQRLPVILDPVVPGTGQRPTP
jgi:serine protease Do